jgi:hypothetical protein
MRRVCQAASVFADEEVAMALDVKFDLPPTCILS